VRFEPCHVKQRVAAERTFICVIFGEYGVDWTSEMHFTTFDSQSVWNVTLSNGKNLNIYFETEGTIYDPE